jgi:hypothetical protein
MRAEKPILLRFLNVLTSLNDFVIKRIVFLFLVKYIASGTLRMNCIGSEGNTHGQTDIYYIPPPSRWIAGGIKNMCRIKFY